MEKDIEFRCLQTKASAFIGDSTSVQKFLKVQENCSDIKHIVQVDPRAASTANVIDFFSKLSKIPQDVVFGNRNISIADPALIYFTSGTSGPPKMVQHNHISYPLGRKFQIHRWAFTETYIAHTLTGKHWLRLSPGKVYWNLSEQGERKTLSLDLRLR